MDIDKIEINRIDPYTSYIVNVEVGNLDTCHMQRFLEKVKEQLHDLGLEKFLLVPCRNGKKALEFTSILSNEINL